MSDDKDWCRNARAQLEAAIAIAKMTDKDVLEGIEDLTDDVFTLLAGDKLGQLRECLDSRYDDNHPVISNAIRKSDGQSWSIKTPEPVPMYYSNGSPDASSNSAVDEFERRLRDQSLPPNTILKPSLGKNPNSSDDDSS